MFPTPWTVQVKPHLSGALTGFGAGPFGPDPFGGEFVAVVDEYGNDAAGFGPPVDVPVYGWAPAGSTEIGGNRATVTADLELYAPPTFACSPQDEVVVAGVTYTVEGTVEDFNHGPFGFAPGVRVALRKVSG